jgi:hypothetical protein
MTMMTHDETARIEAIDSAVAGVRAAATTALQLDYRGLAAALEDLAVVLGAVPADDALRVAQALLSSARRG